VYQFRCWFALASGYDRRSLGAEGKNTWMVIANKSRVEKPLCRAVIFLRECSHCGYNFFSEEIGKIRFTTVKSRKKWKKIEEINKVYKPQN
jgi:hypothetical protein